MAAADVHFAFAHKRIETRFHALQLRRGVARVLFGPVGHAFDRVAGGFEGHGRDLRRRGVTRPVGEPGEGQGVGRAAALVIQPERIGPAKAAATPSSIKKRKRSPQAGHDQPILDPGVRNSVKSACNTFW